MSLDTRQPTRTNAAIEARGKLYGSAVQLLQPFRDYVVFLYVLDRSQYRSGVKHVHIMGMQRS